MLDARERYLLWLEETNRFVGPVVLHEDILSSVLSSVSEQHDYFITVGPRNICLLRNTLEKGNE